MTNPVLLRPVESAGTYDGGYSVDRSYLTFDARPIKNYQVNAATLSMYELWAWSCSPRPMVLADAVGGISAGTDWYNQPGIGATDWYGSFAYGWNAAGVPGGASPCPQYPSSGVQFGMTAAVQGWAGNPYGWETMVAYAANEGDSYAWKRFSSAHSTHPPYLTVTYDPNCTYYPQTGHSVCGAIRDKYNALGGPSSALGYPTNDTSSAGGGGYYSEFQHGEITWTSADGAHYFTDPIRAKYDAIGGSGRLGFATADQGGQPASGAWAEFDTGMITTEPAAGTHWLADPLRARYDALGGAGSPLGWPTDDEHANPDGQRVDLQGGFLLWQSGRNLVLARLNPTGPLAAGSGPGYSYETRRLSDRAQLQVNRGSGDLQLQVAGIMLAGRTAGLSVGAGYSSLAVADDATQPSGLGPGWSASTAPSVRLVRYGAEPNTTVDYYAPGGHVYSFHQVSAGGFDQPVGVDATLTEGSGVYTLAGHASGLTDTFDYTTGTLSSETDRNHNTVRFTRSGSTLTVTGTRGAALAGSFDGAGRLTSWSQRTASGASRQVSYGYDSAGLLTSIGDPAGGSWSLGYDSLDDLTSITDPAGVVTRVGYDNYGRATSVVADAGTGRINATTSFGYDDANRQVSVTDPDGHPPARYVHDTAGLITDAYDAAGAHQSATFNGDAKPTSTTSAGGGTTSYGYANSGESLASIGWPGGANASSAYTNTSPSTKYLPASTTDSMGHTTSYSYDGSGNPLSTAAGSGGQTGQASLTYNADGTVATATTPANQASHDATTFGYDGAGNLTSITPPPSNHGNLAAQRFSYDGYGRLATTTTGRGVTISYGYDNADRITSVSFSDGTPTVAYAYDAVGNLTRRTDAAGLTVYSYDPLGRLTGKSGTAVPGGPLSYGYDPAGNLTSLTDGRGTTRYSYDARNLLTSMVEGKTGRTDSFGYDADHRRTDAYYDTGGSTAVPPPSFAVHLHQSYTAGGQLAGISATTRTGATPVNLAYAYYDPAVGRQTTVRQQVTDQTSGAVTSYSYDSVGRLAAAATSGGGPSYSYGYDADGNLTSGSAGTHSYNAVDQLADPGVSYDASGNLTASPGSSPALLAASYTGAEQTASLTPAGSLPVSIGYAGTSQAEPVHVGTPTATTTLTQGQAGLQATTGGGGTVYYERDPAGTLIAQQNPDGTENYYVPDGLGSTVALINPAGTLTASYSYTPFGGGLTATGPAAAANPYRYAGGYYNTSTGLYQYGTRYYDPTLGRWTQPDPLRHLLSLQDGNPYAYAGDNPTNNIDPSGKSWACAAAIGLIATGVFVAAMGGLLVAGLGAITGILAIVVGGSDAASIIGVSALIGGGSLAGLGGVAAAIGC